MRRFSLQWGLILTGAVLLLALGISFGPTLAAPPGQASTGQPGAAPAAPFAVLYDQYNSAGASSTNSQQYEPGTNFTARTDQAADDFPLPADVTWAITQVQVLGTASNASFQPTAFNVFFYTSTGTLPGTPVYSATNQLYTGTSDYSINLTSTAVLTGGISYWVSVQAVLNSNGGSRLWSWGNRSGALNNPAAWRNPAGGYPSASCPNWTVRTTCLGSFGPD